MLLIKNGKILTMADKDFDTGDILIDDGKIVDIDDSIIADGAEVFDAKGCTIIPGIVDPHCHIGMWEDGIDKEGADGNEMTDPITPELRAIDAINPLDRCFREALEGGVTTVVTGPGSANVIGGQFVAMKTYGTCVDEMVIKAPQSLKAALGENPKGVYGEQKKSPSTRMATAALLRSTLVEAGQYNSEVFGEKPPRRDLKNEILVQVLDGEVPMKIHCHRADDIMTAIRIAREFDLTISLDHCTEGYLIPEYIKASGAKIIIGPLLAAGVSRGRTFAIAACTGLVEVVGTVLGYFAISVASAILPFALAFAGGTMLYVISDEMIPETHHNGNQKLATYSLLVGFCIMLVMDYYIG